MQPLGIGLSSAWHMLWWIRLQISFRRPGCNIIYLYIYIYICMDISIVKIRYSHNSFVFIVEILISDKMVYKLKLRGLVTFAQQTNTDISTKCMILMGMVEIYIYVGLPGFTLSYHQPIACIIIFVLLRNGDLKCDGININRHTPTIPDCFPNVRLTLKARFMGPTWGPPGSCRPQVGPISASWTLLSGDPSRWPQWCWVTHSPTLG